MTGKLKLPIALIFSLISSLLSLSCTMKLSSPGPENGSSQKSFFKLISEEQNEITPERLARIGKVIIFGTEETDSALARGEIPIGRGQCPLCHRFFAEQKADRAPALMAVEARSHLTIKEDRYQMFAALLSEGEPDSGIKPHAQSGGEYLLESEYCPSCYTVPGFAVQGSRDLESLMPVLNKPPIGLTDFQMVAVAAYLQSHDTPGNDSKVTAVEEWEHYFGKKLPLTPEDIYLAAHLQFPPLQFPPRNTFGPAADDLQVALPTDTPEQMVRKMNCHACHKIPGISIAKSGEIGPLLIMKTSAARRIKSSAYQKAVKQGRAHAKTARGYVIESITNPGAFIVPGFADEMLKDYSHKFTLAGLEKLVDYLMEQDAAAALREGLDRLPNEKEGSLLVKSRR
ncbi:MAG TPA: hypothetical protein VFA47_04555 [Candidatus Manganitrophaceae bacterium]|nr:hypothetical protein [Candidatus Manganitrophaceae bacterium]